MTKSSNQPDSVPNAFAFEVGQYFRSGVTVFIIVDVRGGHLVVENASSLERKYVNLAEIEKLYISGNVIPCTKSEAERALRGDSFVEDDASVAVAGAISLLSEKARATGLKNIKYIQALRERGYHCLRPTSLTQLEYERLAKEFADTNPPKLSTLYRIALRIDRRGGDLRAAFPSYAARGGRGQRRFREEAVTELQRVIDDLKKSPTERVRFETVKANLRTALEERFGKELGVALLPSSSTVARAVKESLGAYEICARNKGKKEANSRYRNWHPRDVATEILEVVEFDDKDTRVFGIDDYSGLPTGRIYLTAGVDQHSWAPLGFAISDQPRNRWSAISAFVNAVLPKDLSLPEWSEVRSEVPYRGKMGIAIFDNALYNHANDMEAAVAEVSNAIVAWAKPRTPTEKSKVEGFNGLLVTDFLPSLDGFMGEKDSRDRLSEGLIAANLSVFDFKRRLLKWVYDVLCNTPCSDGNTRLQKWCLGMQHRRLMMPWDINKVLLAAMLNRTVRLRPELLLFTGLNYQNQALAALRRRLGHNARIDFKYHPEKLQEVFVRDPFQNEWFSVESTNPEYTRNLTLYQHTLIRKMARENKVSNPSVHQLMHYRSELVKLVAQARNSPKLRERKTANRIAGSHSTPWVLMDSPATTPVVTELENQVLEIAAVEMEDGDEGWTIPTLAER